MTQQRWRQARAFVTAFCLMGTVVVASPAKAWWGAGHMAIALIAYQKMRPETRLAVDTILKAHPDYAAWSAEVPKTYQAGKEQGKYIFAIAATWPDRIKNPADKTVGAKFYDPLDKRRTLPSPLPTDPRYPDLSMHKEWHYVDVPLSMDGKDRDLPEGETVLTQIPVCEKNLADTQAPLSKRAYYVAWLEHLIGDVHQPLHATERFTTEHPDGDQGGNGVKLESSSRATPSSLHGYWDSLLGATEDWDSVEKTVAAVLAAEPTQLAGFPPVFRDDPNPARWTAESYSLAQSVVYTLSADDTKTLPQPDAAYHDRAQLIAYQRAALAGIRLARALDTALIVTPTK